MNKILQMFIRTHRSSAVPAGARGGMNPSPNIDLPSNAMMSFTVGSPPSSSGGSCGSGNYFEITISSFTCICKTDIKANVQSDRIFVYRKDSKSPFKIAFML